MTHSIDRRALLAAGLLLPSLAPRVRAQAVAPDPAALSAAEARSAQAHTDLMEIPGLVMHGSERMALLLYPGFTALDLVGPHYFFACLMGATVALVTTGGDLAPVASDLGLAIAPTATLAATEPAPFDVVFVPGGTMGTLAVMEDPAALDWLRAAAASARLVTSVCTGSLVLGAAGLLRGRRATSHWAGRAALAAFGAVPVDARLVEDGPVITGAGVSAGLDLGLLVAKRLRGAAYAQALRLQAEYAPEPPVPGGTLATTDQAIATAMAGMFAPFAVQAQAIAARLGR